MISCIEELWFGNIEPIKVLEQNDSEAKELEALIQRNHELLKKYLTKEDASNRFEIYEGCVEEYITAVTKASFSEGFKLGLKFAVEALV